MSKLKIIALATVLSFSIAACDSKRSSATLGGSQDTTNAPKGGADVSSNDTAKSSGTDSTSHGNANPNGRGTTDTSKTRP